MVQFLRGNYIVHNQLDLQVKRSAKMRLMSVMASLPLFLAVSGCISPMQQFKLGLDTCGLSKTRSLIGGSIDDVDMDVVVGEKYLTRLVDPRVPDRVYTTDLRVRRQNVVLDDNGVFIESYCG